MPLRSKKSRKNKKRGVRVWVLRVLETKTTDS